MNLRPYQIDAVSYIYRKQRGIVHAPAGSGKTIMMAAALDMALREGIYRINRVVVMANTIEQCQQIETAFARFDLPDRVAIQICCAAGKPETDGADLLIVDECHHAPAPLWATHINKAKGLRWGFTATPYHPDADRNQSLFDLFSDSVFEVKRWQLVEDGHLTPAEVRWLDRYDVDIAERIADAANTLIEQRKARMPYLFRSADSAAEQQRRAHWQAASQIGLCDNQDRTQAIIDTANEHADNSVLILIATIDYGTRLCDDLPFAGLCHSKIGKKKRAYLIDAFKNGELPILIASTLADEGLDVPCADVLIIGNAGRSATKLEQRTGRVLRPYPGKERGIIYDFKDTFDPMLRAQSYARRRLYTKLKYEQK